MEAAPKLLRKIFSAASAALWLAAQQKSMVVRVWSEACTDTLTKLYTRCHTGVWLRILFASMDCDGKDCKIGMLHDEIECTYLMAFSGEQMPRFGVGSHAMQNGICQLACHALSAKPRLSSASAISEGGVSNLCSRASSARPPLRSAHPAPAAGWSCLPAQCAPPCSPSANRISTNQCSQQLPRTFSGCRWLHHCTPEPCTSLQPCSARRRP